MPTYVLESHAHTHAHIDKKHSLSDGCVYVHVHPQRVFKHNV